MMGTALSRWTMSYFTAALAFLVGAQVLMIAGYGFPAVPAEAPETLILVHMVTIGWLSLLMCGALFQFVPVLIAQPLRGGRLVLPALICLLSGLAFLLAGFLQLAGTIDTDLPLLAVAGMLLPAGFLLVVGVLVGTLLRANLTLPARFVAAGLACVLVTVTLGALFALLLSGFLPALAGLDFRTHALPVHIAVGLGGWLTFTAIGVSPPNLLDSTNTLGSMMNVVTWEFVGYNMIILYAALRSIPAELFEAAEIDGASQLRVAWSIKIPAIRPAILLTVIFSIIGTFQLFNEPSLLANIAPTAVGDSFTPNLYAYNLAFINQDVNYAAAIAFLLGVVIAVISFVVQTTVARREGVTR